MTKLLLALITTAAFFYALYLLARKRPLKIVSCRENESGTVARARYLFLLATAIIAGTWSARVTAADAPSISDTPPSSEGVQIFPKHPPLFYSLCIAWRMLNTFVNNGEKPDRILMRSEGGEIGRDAAITTFKAVTAKAVSNGLLSRQAAEELVIVHTALASHFLYSSMRLSCYKMAWSGAVLQKTSAELLAQLALLRDAKEKNTLSAEVIAKATEAIRKQVEILTQLNRYDVAWNAAMAVKDTEQLAAVTRTIGTKLDTAIKNNTLTISPATIEATALILELENATAATVPATPDKPVAPPPSAASPSAASPSAPTAPAAPQTPEQRKPQ